ncbi:FkbM family methyltransferase, partial [bacterium]|nr:FkbM family methyltransferase [bacterium]
MNFSAIPDNSIGKLLRVILKLIPAGTQVRIIQGRLKGRKWIVGSSVNGCWLGSYELDKQKLIEKTIQPGEVVYDLGANVGFYTLLS